MTNPKHDLDAAAALAQSAAVTGVDRRTLDAIFRHPLSHNLSWREVVNLFTAVGGAEEKHNGEFAFRAGDETLAMKRPHSKDLTGPEVIDLRRFLTRAGWSPSALPSLADADAAPTSGLIVVIDHAGAKVYRIDPSTDDGQGVMADDPRRLLHHLERKRHDEDRDETYPDDELFFEQVANAVASGGEIVVIGHGKGQSNEADHLTAYLKAHHKQTAARIVREIVADLPHLTTPELLDLGRHALVHASGMPSTS
jgi:hypothetical protein